MPNKKKIRNGFFFFMQDVRQEYEARGERMSMASLQHLCSPKWNALPQEEKDMYNARAKDLKHQGASDLERKFDSLGVSFAARGAQQREREEEQSLMKITIKKTVELTTQEDLLDKPFYFCHVNYYFATWVGNASMHTPCEIALLEMNLRKGITDTLHYIIHPGDIPLGTRGEAKTWAEATHGIPLSDTIGDERITKEKNLVTIFSKIVGFLKRDSIYESGRLVLPPIYTMPDSNHNNTSLTAVKDALAKFSEAAHEQRDLFRVYPLAELICQIERKYGELPPEHNSPSIWESELVKDVFSYAPNLECSFHEKRDLSMHCSLSKVRRWAHTTCDLLCPIFGVDMVAGKHLPDNADLSGVAVYASKRSESPSSSPAPAVHTEPVFWKDVESHTKKKDQRVREKDRVDEELARAAELPLPRKFVNSQASTQEEDFPALGAFPPLGGRGKPNPQTQDLAGGVWPVSGRGRLLFNKK